MNANKKLETVLTAGLHAMAEGIGEIDGREPGIVILVGMTTPTETPEVSVLDVAQMSNLNHAGSAAVCIEAVALRAKAIEPDKCRELLEMLRIAEDELRARIGLMPAGADVTEEMPDNVRLGMAYAEEQLAKGVAMDQPSLICFGLFTKSLLPAWARAYMALPTGCSLAAIMSALGVVVAQLAMNTLATLGVKDRDDLAVAGDLFAAKVHETMTAMGAARQSARDAMMNEEGAGHA